jgi:hypothetical protein
MERPPSDVLELARQIVAALPDRVDSARILLDNSEWQIKHTKWRTTIQSESGAGDHVWYLDGSFAAEDRDPFKIFRDPDGTIRKIQYRGDSMELCFDKAGAITAAATRYHTGSCEGEVTWDEVVCDDIPLAGPLDGYFELRKTNNLVFGLKTQFRDDIADGYLEYIDRDDLTPVCLHWPSAWARRQWTLTARQN